MSDDELEQLLRRTRASRDRIKARLASVGEAPTSRSPLREKNVSVNINVERERSPLKQTFKEQSFSSPTKTIPTGSSFSKTTLRSTTSSPTKSSPISSPTKSSFLQRQGSQHRREEESFNREVTEKTTTVLSSPKRSPGGTKETFTKTTITETEETIEKKEILKITEYGQGDDEKVLKMFDRLEKKTTDTGPTPRRVIESKTVTFKNSPIVKTVFTQDDESDSEGSADDVHRTSPTMGSPSRFGSCRDMSQSASSFGRPSPYPEKKLDAVLDDDVETGRKQRLQALASKFKVYDDDETELSTKKTVNVPTTPSSGSPCRSRDRTKVVDVDREINRVKVLPNGKTDNLTDDPAFLTSLKAQGFEESNSKTKLVYDFSTRGRCESPSKRNDSPVRSPFKINPHQFISAQKPSVSSPSRTTGPIPAQRSASPSKSTASPSRATNSASRAPASAYRSTSPTRMVSSPARATSPFRPHPLQFVSPQKAAEAAALASLPSKPDAEGPPKPARTYATPARNASSDDTDESSDEPPRTWRTEKTLTLTPLRSSPQKTTSELTDTASRKTLAEKRNLFEESSSPAAARTPDPALLPMSERRKLFEKNLTVPKPIARFGESVTPAMLSRANVETTPNVRPPPKTFMTEPAWKRKREVSPERQFITPTPKMGVSGRRSPPKTASSSNVEQRFEKSRRLFENSSDDWRESEIAKSREQEKESDMRLLLNRFNYQRNKAEQDLSSTDENNTESTESGDDNVQTQEISSPKTNYPGVNSLKKIKVSPPKEGQLYPNLDAIHDERPDTAMSGESVAPSEAPSLGSAIKRVASAHRRETKMATISENAHSDEEELEFSISGNQLDAMLDEALDDSCLSDEGPTPPKMKRNVSASRKSMSSPSGTSAASWEYEVPEKQKDFKTPRVDNLSDSPQAPLPRVCTELGPTMAEDLIHSVSFYRKSKPPVQVNITPLRKVVRNPAIAENESRDEEATNFEFKEKIRKLQEDINEQLQRRLQASKALDVCQAQNEFEGSCERVEFERLLLEAHHKYAAASAEINRLKSRGAKAGLAGSTSAPISKGSVSISGLSLQLKPEFVKLLSARDGPYLHVHYFVCLVKYRSQVIASQMLSTADGVSRGGRLNFTNLININDLDFDFRIFLEVYGLQTRREQLSHEEKYHIKKEKSMFNLTPLKKMKKQDSRFVRHENPVNNISIRKPRFGVVGCTTITIDSLQRRSFRLEDVPSTSPLDGGLEMKLSVHSESKIEETGFLTIFNDVKGLGDWNRRWCKLKDNTLLFWKYPEEEEKGAQPCFQISLHNCITENVTLAPRDICSRMNTFMIENQRPMQPDDREGQIVIIDPKRRVTTLRHLLMADTREERINWCDVLNKTLAVLRAWDPTSLRPRSGSQSSSSQESDGESSGSTIIW